MYDFLDEIASKTGLPFDILNKGFRIINFSNKSIYIEGFTNIVSFENEEIVLKLKKGIIKIQGKDIKIKNMSLETIVIVGDILFVEIS